MVRQPDQLLDSLEVGLSESPIPGYVGVKEPLGAHICHLAYQLRGLHRGALGPPFYGNLPVTGVHGHHYVVAAPGGAQLPYETRVPYRGRPKHHPVNSHVQQPLGRPEVPNAAAHLKGNGQPRYHGLYHGQVSLLSRGSPIQVHHVQPGGSLPLPARGHAHRVIGVDCLPAVVSLIQPHT